MRPLMNVSEPPISEASAVETREWWLWSSVISFTLLLTMRAASFALPALLSGVASFHAFALNQAVRGLWGLVLVFDIYAVYQQLQINRIRHEFADNLEELEAFVLRQAH
jgi:hypothetical protein